MQRLSIIDLKNKKKKKEKIVATTSYDAAFAKLIDPYVDIVLVGDSLGMVIKGDENTLGVTLDEVIYHTRAVHKMVRQAHLVSDMPFLSYQLSKREAVRNAGRLLQAGAQSVKIEGGERFCELVSELTGVGIPVMGHLGMTPQSVHQMGGFRVQGREAFHRDRLLCDAKRLEEAGAYAIVLESIPEDLAGEMTAALEIPTIGIGAGVGCDGQVLVIYDLLGIDPAFQPKFVKRYANLSETIQDALKKYSKEVREGTFPDQSHSYHARSYHADEDH